MQAPTTFVIAQIFEIAIGFTFSTRDNKAILRAVNQYIPSDRLVRSLSFFQVLHRGLIGTFRRIFKR